MFIITKPQIQNLQISPKTCVDWIKESFTIKDEAIVPVKTRIVPQDMDYINSMPTLIPNGGGNLYGCKVVFRMEHGIMPNGSVITLLDSKKGDFLAFMDASWITVMRTGAVAAFVIQKFRQTNALTYSIVGLGNIARATLLCLLENEPDKHFHILLYRYKDQAELFIKRFKSYKNVTFEVYDNIKDILPKTDVLIGCVTNATKLYSENEADFKQGCLIVPIQQKGFQNCDLFFDKIFGDDTAGLSHYQYFTEWKDYAEITDVLKGRAPGRTSDSQRILVYCKGIGIHDLVFANHIYERILDTNDQCLTIDMFEYKEKFWI